MGRYDALKQAVWEANMEIPRRNLALFTWGNVSAIDRGEGVFAIKPSGVPYETLKADDIVVVDLEGKTVEGSLNPSSDMKTHLVLYNAFEKIGGITHTHSPHAVGWAQACKPVPVFGTTHADHSHLAIPCTPMMGKDQVEGNYEHETGVLITKVFEHINYAEQPMVLVAGHGPFAWGKDAANSVYNAVVLEEICKMAWITLGVNPHAQQLPDYLREKHYQRKHGPNAYYGQK
ncbi:MAG: L-ribulose-5-phosphate 4-epimerase [Sphaerochaetaceae bacterium]|jgi:L-ribulose-5-phosphate 4-epimerase|nr:L-ribulose-5-phosphate 4-epimerase [Sphaerochaetaceae bacterium]MDD3941331.1 L-ribulose-5-phosphate 4-epimerase [Sphaerochaetaceae bacterium]MDX9940295.1 L-ribulose-5-phosphate 4-epimerase [Sphaerochaetaceae bacterium]